MTMNISPTINRSLILVVPKQPFYDWSNAQFPDATPTLINQVDDYNSYLLEDELFLDNPKEELEKYWRYIFLNELYGQCTDTDSFPELSWELFVEWFDFYKSSLVTNLIDEPLDIQYDDY